jgi:hypothetical protein
MMLQRLTITFSDAERRQLARMSEMDVRPPKDFVRWLLFKEARERGMISEKPPPVVICLDGRHLDVLDEDGGSYYFRTDQHDEVDFIYMLKVMLGELNEADRIEFIPAMRDTLQEAMQLLEVYSDS